MNFRKIFLPLVIVFAATAVRAAVQTSETPANKGDPDLALIGDAAGKTEPVIPKRALKFDVSEEEQSLALQNVQEGMLDQRNVATFRFKLEKKEITENFPNVSRTIGIADLQPIFLLSSAFREAFRSIERERNETRDLDGLFSNFSRFQNNVMGFYNPYHRFFSWINSRVSQGFLNEHPPAKRIDVDFVKNNPFVQVSSASKDSAHYMEISLLAANVEEAERWTSNWLNYYDWALCYPAQKECLNLIKNIAERLPSYRREIERAESELNNLKKDTEKFNEFEELKPESLAGLITQRRMLSIDLVGLNARIEACNKMLADKNAARSRKDQVETAKAAAEIELLGLEAKQKEINRIIQGAQDRQKHFARISSNQDVMGYNQRLIKSSESAIKSIENYQLGYKALPVEDNKVTIRRIKWTSPAKDEKK